MRRRLVIALVIVIAAVFAEPSAVFSMRTQAYGSAHTMLGHIDVPGRDVGVASDGFWITGWAFDQATGIQPPGFQVPVQAGDQVVHAWFFSPDNTQVWHSSQPPEFHNWQERPDVAAAYGCLVNVGFSVKLMPPPAPGQWNLILEWSLPDGTFQQWLTVTVVR